MVQIASNARTKQTLGKMNEQSDQRRDSFTKLPGQCGTGNQKSHTAENSTTDLRQPMMVVQTPL